VRGGAEEVRPAAWGRGEAQVPSGERRGGVRELGLRGEEGGEIGWKPSGCGGGGEGQEAEEAEQEQEQGSHGGGVVVWSGGGLNRHERESGRFFKA
jgi:hypothetical protein